MPDRRSGRVRAAATALGVFLLVLALSAAAPASAQIGSARYSSIVVDAQTGIVVSSINADEQRFPASLTKMMTLYMLFEALRDRRVALNQYVPVSAHAASMSPTKLGLVPGTRITVEEAILGLVTKSANDAAAALGEMMGGSEDRFAQMMTLRARALGMTRTTFRNASGLPDPDQVSTARDLSTLGRRLITDFPGYYGYFSTPSFRFHNRVVFNHDRLLQTYPGADGLKTGYTVASGYNLVTSAVRGGVRLIGVVLGARSGGERDIHMVGLLDQGFERMDVPVAHARRPERSFPTLVSTAQAATLPAVVAASRQVRLQASRFGVQVGVFKVQSAAQGAANAARRITGAGDARVEAALLHGKKTWRAQLAGMSAVEAQNACAAMARRKTPCIVLRPETGQVASR